MGMPGSDKFYTVPVSGGRMDGLIVPASSKDRAERLGNIHAQNMTPEPPTIKKSEIHVSTALELSQSNKWEGGGRRYIVVNERIE